MITRYCDICNLQIDGDVKDVVVRQVLLGFISDKIGEPEKELEVYGTLRFTFGSKQIHEICELCLDAGFKRVILEVFREVSGKPKGELKLVSKLIN